MAIAQNSVVIVSAFGRGHWMAVELQRSGLEVTLLDVTEKMGSSVPEDAEGPFGFFYSEKKKESQLERFLEGDPPLTLANGFTIWLNEGPLEMKSSLTLHRLDQLQVKPDVRSTVLSADKDGYKKIQGLSFSENWLSQISTHLAQVVYNSHTELPKYFNPLPLFSNFMMILPTRQGHQKSLDWCRRQGVNVVEKVEVIDFSYYERKVVRGIEIKQDKSDLTRMIEGQKFVWCLTSEESQILGTKIQDHLYPNGLLEPEWIWARYRIKTQSCLERDQLPSHFLMIEDLEKPWTHENLGIVIRTASPDVFDYWIRISNIQRFNKEHLEFRGQRIIELLNKRMELLAPVIAEYPNGYDNTYSRVGPARLPIYNQYQKEKFQTGQFSNVQFDSPEQWDGLGWDGAFDYQGRIITDTLQWWKVRQEQLRKQMKLQEGSEVNHD